MQNINDLTEVKEHHYMAHSVQFHLESKKVNYNSMKVFCIFFSFIIFCSISVINSFFTIPLETSSRMSINYHRKPSVLIV